MTFRISFLIRSFRADSAAPAQGLLGWIVRPRGDDCGEFSGSKSHRRIAQKAAAIMIEFF
jgi:hypothetical protein